MNHKPTLVLTKDTLKPSYEATVREIAEIKARLEQLEELRAAMEKIFDLPPSTPSRVLEIPAGMLKRRERAPHGALKAAVLALFNDGRTYSNADVRERLVEAGYPHAVENMNLRKTLDRLSEAGDIVAHHKDGRVTFSRQEKTKRS